MLSRGPCVAMTAVWQRGLTSVCSRTSRSAAASCLEDGVRDKARARATRAETFGRTRARAVHCNATYYNNSTNCGGRILYTVPVSNYRRDNDATIHSMYVGDCDSVDMNHAVTNVR